MIKEIKLVKSEYASSFQKYINEAVADLQKRVHEIEIEIQYSKTDKEYTALLIGKA